MVSTCADWLDIYSDTSCVELEMDAQQMRSRWDQAKERSPSYGPERPKLPGPWGNAPHLTGTMPGDYGFDPLGLWTVREEWQGWIAEAELLHGRWAMLAVVGVLVPELLSVAGVDIGEPVWWKVRRFCAFMCSMACMNTLVKLWSSCQGHMPARHGWCNSTTAT
jgi:hypothetical protein